MKNLKIIKGKVSNPGLYLFNDKDNLNSLLSFAGSLSKNFIISVCKLALNEDLYPSGDITSSLIENNNSKKECYYFKDI